MNRRLSPTTQIRWIVFGPNLEQVLNAAGFYKKKEWVGLTDEEIKDIVDCGRPDYVNIKKAEQKLKDRNT